MVILPKKQHWQKYVKDCGASMTFAEFCILHGFLEESTNSYIKAMKFAWNSAKEEYRWQTVETIPEDIFVDVFMKSKENPLFGTRVCNVCKSKHVTGGWTGIPDHLKASYIYVSHWMPRPHNPE